MLLKEVVGAAPPSGSSAPVPTRHDQVLSENELSCDGDLLVLRPEAPQPSPTSTGVVTRNTPWLPVPPSGPAAAEASPSRVPAVVPELPSTHLASPAASYPDATEVTIRRTILSTAGQHRNVHHLPMSLIGLAPAAQNPPDPTSNAVSVL